MRLNDTTQAYYSPYMSKAMIFYSWVLYIGNAFFMLIMLLNFLIAIISTSYDSVMTRSTIVMYNQRCTINCECSLILNFLQNFTTRGQSYAKVFVLGANIADTDVDNSFTGIVRPIKAIVTANNK